MADGRLSSVLRQLRRLGSEPAPFDRDLLVAFQDRRDPGAFAALVTRHGAMVLRVCRRLLRHEQDAEDAFQASFLVLARKAASLRRGGELASWLYGVARRTALNARRAGARRLSHEARAPTKAEPTPSSRVAWQETQEALAEEIERLPDRYRAPFVLCFLEGRSRAETAQTLGLKEGTVWSPVNRGPTATPDAAGQAGHRTVHRVGGRGLG